LTIRLISLYSTKFLVIRTARCRSRSILTKSLSLTFYLKSRTLAAIALSYLKITTLAMALAGRISCVRGRKITALTTYLTP